MSNVFNLEQALKNDIVCQRRTGKSKKYTFIKDNLIYKGPYKQDRLNVLFQRSEFLKQWNAPYIIHPNSEILTSDVGYFVTFPNLALDYPIQCEPHTESFSGISYNVLIRNGLVKLGDIIMKLDWIGSYLPQIALSLLELYILGVGDTGFFNILVDNDKKQIYIIDYDENRSNTEKDINDEFFMFSKKPAKDKANLWLQYVRPHYESLANELLTLISDNGIFNKQIHLVINRLQHLHQNLQVSTPIQSNLNLNLNLNENIQTISYLNDESGYIVHYPHVINNGLEIFSQLAVEIPWIEEEVTLFGKTTKTGRYVSVHGDPGITYTYAGRIDSSKPWTPTLLILKTLAEKYANIKYNFVFINYYTDGSKKLGWHADDEKDIIPRSPITSISLGSARDFKVKNKNKNNSNPINLTINLGNGDILIMGGALQENYKHSVPAHTQITNPRINLTFRLMNIPTSLPTSLTLDSCKKMTLKELKALDIYKTIPKRSLLKTKKQICLSIINQLSINPLTPTVQNNKNIGKMVFKGMFGGSTTFSGYSIDIVKSALQKYIRRNIIIKALYAGFELYRMVEVDKGIAVQTNCYNRLAIIACEDIGPANLPLIIKVVELVLDKNRDPATLATMIQLMCNSEKTRIMSHLNRTYATTEGKTYARKIGFHVDDTITEEDSQYILPLIQSGSKYWKEGDPTDIRYLAEMFLLRLQQKSFMAIDWLGRYREAVKNIKVVSRKRRTDPIVIIWEMLSTILPSKVHDILSRAYFKMSEKGPFLMTAVVAALYSTPYQEIYIASIINTWKDHPTLLQLLNGEYEFQVDEYVIDKHTVEGKSKGASRDKFVKEGTQVIPQSELYYIKQFEDIYINS